MHALLEKAEKFLEKHVGIAGLVCAGIVLCGVILLPNTLVLPEEVDPTFDYYLTKKERLIFKPASEQVEWCKKNKECATVAEALVYEARSETELGRASVAHVILNRVRDPRWGDTVREVVYQPWQFSYTMKKQRNKPSKKDWKAGYLLAFEVMNGMMESPVGDATFYHKVNMKKFPKWASHYEVVAVMDTHIFYR